MHFVLKDSHLFWGGVVGCLMALVFLAYGLLPRKPLYFNALNPYKGSISVRTARLVYTPLGIVLLILALRDVIRGF